MVICRAAVPDKEREASAELADDFGMDEQMSPLAGRQNIEFTNRQLVSLILPMLAEQLLGITVGLADSLMVATVGDASISAVSLVDSVSALMIYIFSAMATGGPVVAGQYLGRREREEACKKHLGQFVKNRYKNYNGGKVAFPASAAAKSAQSVHKSAQNA